MTDGERIDALEQAVRGDASAGIFLFDTCYFSTSER